MLATALRARSLSAALAIFCSLLSTARADQAPTFRITNLDQLYGRPEYGATFTDINDAGILVGGIRNVPGSIPGWYTATAFRPDGSMVLIGKLTNQFPSESWAVRISNSNYITGWGDVTPNGNGRIHPWTMRLGVSTGLLDIGMLYSFGGDYAYPFSVNSAGTVVGQGYALGGNRAFTWSVNTGMLSLDPAPIGASGGSAANDINDQGDIVGSHAGVPTLWRPDGSLLHLPLGLQNGANGSAAAVNNNDQVIGSTTIAGATSMFLWSQAAGTLDLGHLAGVTNTEYSFARDINDAGVAIGYDGNRIGNGYGAPFWYSASTGMLRLEDLIDPNDPMAANLKLDGVTAINNLGQIIGVAFVDGHYVNVLLSPVPEASTTSMLALGCLCVLAAARRRYQRH